VWRVSFTLIVDRVSQNYVQMKGESGRCWAPENPVAAGAVFDRARRHHSIAIEFCTRVACESMKFFFDATGPSFRRTDVAKHFDPGVAEFLTRRGLGLVDHANSFGAWIKRDKSAARYTGCEEGDPDIDNGAVSKTKNAYGHF
jgi:hypothetical protein